MDTTQTRAIGRRSVLLGAGGVILGGGAVALGSTGAHAVEYSQNGWTAGSSSTIPITTLAVGAASFAPGVRKGDAHTILGYVARRFDSEVEALVKGWCWGHAYRPIRGGSTLSNHASGTAIDVNAPRHPLGKAGTFSSAQAAKIRSIVAACNGVVRWGGDYSGRKDEMHFEINVGPSDPRIAQLVATIGGGGGGTPPPPPPNGRVWSLVKQGATGHRVRAIQYLLRHHGYTVSVDGSFGPVTKGKVVQFQRARGLAADGDVGAKTWAKLYVIVKQGSRSQAVTAVQQALTALGFHTSADGIFGPGTHATVVSFQSSRGLTANGRVDEASWKALVA